MVNEVLDVAMEALGFVNGTKFRLSELTDSVHVAIDGIFSLDDQMVGEDMPTGDPDTSCYAKPAPGKFRRNLLDDEDTNVCQPR